MANSKEDMAVLAADIKSGAIADVDAVYGFDLTGEGGGKFTLDVRMNSQGRLREGLPSDHELEASCTILCSAEHFHSIVEGTMKAETALMFGRLKVIGSSHAALKLAKLF